MPIVDSREDKWRFSLFTIVIWWRRSAFSLSCSISRSFVGLELVLERPNCARMWKSQRYALDQMSTKTPIKTPPKTRNSFAVSKFWKFVFSVFELIYSKLFMFSSILTMLSIVTNASFFAICSNLLKIQASKCSRLFCASGSLFAKPKISGSPTSPIS